MGRFLKPWLLNTWKAGKCSAQDGSPLRVLAASVPQSRDHSKLSWFDAPRAHQKTHPQLWRHPAAPLTCFKRRTSHACKILQNIKTLKTSRNCSMAVAAMELQQATLWYQVGCFLSFDKPSKLKGWAEAASTWICPGSMSACSTQHPHGSCSEYIESKSSSSVQLRRWRALKAALVDSRVWFGFFDVFVQSYTNSWQKW